MITTTLHNPQMAAAIFILGKGNRWRDGLEL